MSDHIMLTPSKRKAECLKPDEVELDEPKISTNQINKPQVRLTEDLLYIINKKLKSTDKAARDQKIQAFDDRQKADYHTTEPFTEVSYRNRSDLNLSQTQLAVTHETYFRSNSIAVCGDNSMEAYLENIDFARIVTRSPDYRDLLCIDRDNKSKVKNQVVRFLQLPEDYIRPHSDCFYLGELAFKLNQDQGSVSE